MAYKTRMTVQTNTVLRLLHSEGRDLYGLEIIHQTGIDSGTVYPMLARMERAGWVTVREERCNPREEGRPVRKFYAITDEGVKAIGAYTMAMASVGVAVDSIRSGAWDRHLDALTMEIRARFRELERG